MGRRHHKARKRTNYGDSVFVGGGGGALVKGNRPVTLEPNQSPFFAVKPHKKYEVGQR